VADSIEQTTVVPASGRFEWHVNPSGRPFVNQNEAYRFTCEDGGSVVEGRDVVVKRGERANLGPICGASADAAPQAPAAAPAPAPVAKAPSKATKKKLTAYQRRVLRKCLAKVNRTAKARRWSKKRRAASRRACERWAAKAKAPRKRAKKRKR
jgi:hypothetical protein